MPHFYEHNHNCHRLQQSLTSEYGDTYKGNPKSQSMPPGPDEKIIPLQECHYTENENIIHISDKQNVQAGGVWCPSIRDKDQGEASRSTTFLAWHKLTLWWKEGHNKLRLEMRSSYSVELLDIYHIPSLALIDASVKGHLKISGGFFGCWLLWWLQRNPLKWQGPTVLISISPAQSS